MFLDIILLYIYSVKTTFFFIIEVQLISLPSEPSASQVAHLVKNLPAMQETLV